MLINKYIKEAKKTELLSYKLVLSSQIIENEKTIDLIDAQINKNEAIKKEYEREILGVK
jgi:hypothetical protein